MPEVKITLDVTCPSEEILEQYCVDFLTGRGFNVARPNEKWETVGQFKDRLGISWMTVTRKVKAQPGRPNVLLQYSSDKKSKRKRILAILSNPDFDAFCVQNK